MAKKKVYTIANAHLDTIWSWDFETTVDKYIFNTLKDNFALFEKYPEYRFNFEGAYRYELMHEYYPEMWRKMRDYIKSGRWNVCGSAYENGDVNVPSPEALFRNILIGNNYFEKNFGKRSCDIFLPDCFGFGYALPSIMRHANLKGFTTQKLTWGSAYGIPFDIGKWYGVDGNWVYGCTNPGEYVKVLTKVRNNDFVTKKLSENEQYDLPLTAVFHGVGDRGGAPKELSVKTVCSEIAENSDNDIEVLSAPADKIFKDLDSLPDGVKQKLPVWNNELVMTNHAVGGYTSRAIGKRWNRRCEELADMAERACVTANTINRYEYPQDALTRSWKRVIAHQFHDDLPGTSVQRAYRRSWNDYAMSMNQFTNEYSGAVKNICNRFDTSFAKGIAVVINNPMEYERTGIVELRIPSRLRYKNMTAFDCEGNEYPTQISASDSIFSTLLIHITMPPMSYKVLDIRDKKTSCNTSLKVSVEMLENEKYSVKFNSNGDICSIFDKEIKKEILQKPIVTGIFDYDGSKSWPAWELNYKELAKEPQHFAKIKSIKVIEDGVCRVSLKVEKTYMNSIFTSIISLSRGGRCVEVHTETEWESLRSAAKEIFSFTAQSPVATFDLGLGAIKRGNMTEKLFEVPAQKWADITNEDNDFGVSVISECKYGWDKFDNNTLRLTLMHTPLKNYRVDSMQSMMDLGLNRYSYAIHSHENSVGHSTQCAAREFIMPMTAFICSKHDGDLKNEFSFAGLTGNAILRAMKKAENSDEIIIRVGEGEKKEQKSIEFSMFCPIESAREVYASEEHICDVKTVDGKLIFDLKPYEVRSFAIKVKEFSENTCSQYSIPCPNNITAFSENASPTASLSVIQKSVPWEITPKEIYVGGTKFVVSQDKKATLCGGQVLILPAGTKKVHLLVASLSGDKVASFGGKSLVINDIREYYAGWDLYDFHEVAYTKHGKLGFEFTHSHNANGDAKCEQLFFWKVTVSTDKTTFELPVDRDILLLAATADGDENTCSLVTELYDKIRDRKFNYKMNAKEKLGYLHTKNFFMLNDKGNAIKNRNKGRRK